MLRLESARVAFDHFKAGFSAPNLLKPFRNLPQRASDIREMFPLSIGISAVCDIHQKCCFELSPCSVLHIRLNFGAGIKRQRRYYYPHFIWADSLAYFIESDQLDRITVSVVFFWKSEFALHHGRFTYRSPLMIKSTVSARELWRYSTV